MSCWSVKMEQTDGVDRCKELLMDKVFVGIFDWIGGHSSLCCVDGASHKRGTERGRGEALC